MVLNDYEIEISTRHLLDFTQHTKPDFKPTWFHKRYYEKLNDFAHGRIKKLMVFVPPQHGKSEGSTRRLPAFMIGRNPNQKVAIASYSASKARKFNREIQRVIDDNIYREIFPKVKLSNSADGYSRTFDEFEIVGFQGGIKTVGVEGPLTGDPVDVLIMDDLYKDWADAQSETVRQRIQDWYGAVAETRLHNDSQQLMVFTRWHEDDLAGYIQNAEAEDWEILIYPALKETEPTEDDPREVGEALWPEKHSRAKLLKTKKREPHLFDGLYQQDPKPKFGYMFPKSELHYFDPAKLANKRPEFVFIPVDPADKGGDFYAAPVCIVYGDSVYIDTVLFNKRDTDENIPDTVLLAKKYGCNAMTVEGNGGWRLAGKNIRTDIEKVLPNCEVKIINAITNKETRILQAAGWVRNRCVFRQDWETSGDVQYLNFMQNLTAYMREGKNKNDDAPDVLAQLHKWIAVNMPHLI